MERYLRLRGDSEVVITEFACELMLTSKSVDFERIFFPKHTILYYGEISKWS